MKTNILHIRKGIALMAIAVGLSSCTIYSQGQNDDNAAYNQTYDGSGNNVYEDNGSAEEPTITFDNFYTELYPYGNWVNSPSYGRVWVCNVPGFRPYATGGRWVATNMGWSWASDYNWGWAPFHYGRWGFDASFGGWYWVPGYTWGPAWVNWSSSSDMYGWAPMGPGVNINISIGSIPANYWTFVPNRYMGYNNLNNYYVDYRRNTTIIHNTTIINNYNTYHNVRYNSGPAFRDVQHHSGRSIRPVNLVQSNSDRSGGRVNNGQMTVYNPGFRSGNRAGGSNNNGRSSNPTPLDRNNATRQDVNNNPASQMNNSNGNNGRNPGNNANARPNNPSSNNQPARSGFTGSDGKNNAERTQALPNNNPANNSQAARDPVIRYESNNSPARIQPSTRPNNTNRARNFGRSSNQVATPKATQQRPAASAPPRSVQPSPTPRVIQQAPQRTQATRQVPTRTQRSTPPARTNTSNKSNTNVRGR